MIARLATGLLGLAVLVPALLWGGPIVVEAVVAVAVVICLDEYARMAFPDDLGPSLGWLVLAGIVTAWAGLYGTGAALAIAVGFATMGSLIMVLARPGDDLGPAADRVGRYVLGLVWIVGLLPTMVRVRWIEDGGLAWVFVVLAVSWAGDTGGYFAGRWFGDRKLYPLVSPKKTWAGAYGGVAAAIFAVWVVHRIALPQLGPLDMVILGGVGCAVGIVGDLCESLLKRSFGVKDSGWIMPGHGGLLDRIDSVLFVSPFVYAYATLVVG